MHMSDSVSQPCLWFAHDIEGATFVLLKCSVASSEFTWRAYKHSTQLQSSEESLVMEVLASALTVAEAGFQISKKSKDIYHGYRGAEKQMKHAQSQLEQRDLNLVQINQLSQSKKERIRPSQTSLDDAQSSIADIEAALNIANSHLKRRRDRLKWALGRKKECENQIAQNNQTTGPLSLSLLLSICQDM